MEPRERARKVLIRRRATLFVAFMRSLKRKLLANSFLKLPLHLLLRMRSSTMNRKRVIDWSNPKFRKRCARRWESNTLCGIVLKEPGSATYNVGVVHSGESVTLSWHFLRFAMREPANTMCSGDGGLVCFCFMMPGEGDDLRLVLAVVNPLFGAYRVLPSGHGVSPSQLKMMQLVVDKSTRQYQVLLVHDERDSQFAEVSEEDSIEIQWYPESLGGVIFDSGTGVWRNARSSSQVFLGPTIHEERYVRDPGRGWKSARNDAADTCMMDYQGSSRFFGPVAYDCATGKVITVSANSWGTAASFISLSKDRLFELGHCLCEYQIQIVGKDHLGLQTVVKADHLTEEAHAKMKWRVSPLKVLACEGYLLVRGSPSEEIFHHRASYRVVGLFYDMRAGKWVDFCERRQVPESVSLEVPVKDLDDTGEVARAYGGFPRSFESAPIMLCNLDWEAVP